MEAVVKTRMGDGCVELKEVPEPTLRPDDAVIAVKAAGVCGSDIHFYHGNPAYSKFLRTPVVLGHEFCGVIEGLGGNVKNFEEGDRVTCETHAEVCGLCYYCRVGRYNLCPERLGFGYQKDGAFAKYVVVPAVRMHRLPDTVSFEEGALTEPICVTHHALVEVTRIRPGDNVVITGPGPIGLLSLQIAKIQGVGTIAVTGMEMDRGRLALAERLGADVIINAEKEDPVKEVRTMTKGYGAEVVIEASGAALARRQALEMIRRGGQVVLIGHGTGEMKIDLDLLVRKEIALLGSFSHTWENWEKALGLVAKGQLDAKSLITHRFSLAEWKKAFGVAERKEAVKAIFVP